MDQERLDAYAGLLLEFGVALKTGQDLLLDIPVEQRDFARLLAEKAYRMGAQEIRVAYRDEEMDLIHAMYLPEGGEMHISDRQMQETAQILHPKGVSLAFLSPRPRLYGKLPKEKKRVLDTYYNEQRNIVRNAIRRDRIQWCYACLPNREWAAFIYPQLVPGKAYERLWETLLDISMVRRGSDAKRCWLEYYDGLYRWTEKLNALRLDRLHFSNSMGTDITIGLHPQCMWEGGLPKENYTEDYFQCNLPSYEICTTTDRFRADGIVVASKPLYVNGAVIKNFRFEFKGGKVVAFDAEEGKEMLAYLLKTDEGSSFLGEVAFVEADTPIAKANTLFYNSLLDENAACHLALGCGFPGNIRGIDPKNEQEVRDSHVNISSQHIDFMFGTDDMDADGMTHEGRKVAVFRQGKFVL